MSAATSTYDGPSASKAVPQPLGEHRWTSEQRQAIGRGYGFEMGMPARDVATTRGLTTQMRG